MELAQYLSRLAPRDLRIVAELLDHLAWQFRHRAGFVEEEKAQHEALLAERRNIPRLYAELRQDGHSHDEAIALIASRLMIKEDALRQNVAWHLNRQRAAAKDERNILIMRLARKGWTNEEIAAELAKRGESVHPNTVSRTIRAQLRPATGRL